MHPCPEPPCLPKLCMCDAVAQQLVLDAQPLCVRTGRSAQDVLWQARQLLVGRPSSPKVACEGVRAKHSEHSHTSAPYRLTSRTCAQMCHSCTACLAWSCHCKHPPCPCLPHLFFTHSTCSHVLSSHTCTPLVFICREQEPHQGPHQPSQ